MPQTPPYTGADDTKNPATRAYQLLINDLIEQGRITKEEYASLSADDKGWLKKRVTIGPESVKSQLKQGQLQEVLNEKLNIHADQDVVTASRGPANKVNNLNLPISGPHEYISTTLNTKSTLIGAPGELKKLGYATEGLENLFTTLRQKGATINLSGGGLEISGMEMSHPVHIPLFGKSLDAGRAGAKTATQLAEEGVGGLLMFRRGSVYTHVPTIAKYFETGAAEETATGFHLKDIKQFNEYFYDELNKIMKSEKIKNLPETELRGRLETEVRTLLNLQKSRMPGEDTKAVRVTDSVEFSNPMQYSGKNPLTRHQLGFANQVLVDVPEGTELFNLLHNEARARRASQTRASVSGGDRQSVATLMSAHDSAKNAVLAHLQRVIADPTAPKKEKDLIKELNLMFASQSAEWVFNNAIVTEDAKRTFIKLTNADIKQLSILPAQVNYEKGRQFYLSAAPVKINNVYELPGSVAAIMGHAPDLSEGETSIIPGIKANVEALGGEGEVGLGTRSVGIQFLDDRLNKSIFGDASAMMSGELAKRLDIDPSTGKGRTSATVNISMGTYGADGNMRTILSQELYAAIKEARSTASVTQTLNFDTPFALFKHIELTDKDGVVHKIITDDAAALPVDQELKFQSGQKSVSTTAAKHRDLTHANDILRSVKQRGMDPKTTQIHGVRINSSTGELQLIVNDGSKVRMDSGYIFEGQRFSAQNIITKDQTRSILSNLGFSGEELEKLTKLGVVMGDLGLSPDPKRPSHGLNTTLLNNLAEVIRGGTSTAPYSPIDTSTQASRFNRDAAEKLIKHFGGHYRMVTLEGGDSTYQFAGLGSKFDNMIDDKVFTTNFQNLLAELEQSHQEIVSDFRKRTLVELPDPKTLLKHTKSFNKVIEDGRSIELDTPNITGAEKKSIDALKKQKQLLRALGFSNVAIDLTTAAIVSFGGQTMIRQEEPLAKLGTSTAKIRVRELMLLSESLDMSHFADPVSGEPRSAEERAKRIRKAKKRVGLDYMRSNKAMFMPGNEHSLIKQMATQPHEEARPVLAKGSAYKKIIESFEGEEIGTVKRISGRYLGKDPKTDKMVGLFDEQIITVNEDNLTKSERAQKRRGVNVDKTLTSKVNKGTLSALLSSPSSGQKVSIGQLSETILGLVKTNAEGSVAVLSDQAMLMMGPDGPMLVPSAKGMDLKSEKGFLRISKSMKEDVSVLERQISESLGEGISTTEKTKAYYLKLLVEIEEMEANRAGGMDVTEDADRISGRLNKLYGYMAQNTLSKAGTYYNAELSSKYVDFAGRFRLQTLPGLEVFEVGLTEAALRRMADGGRLGQQEALQTTGFGIDAIIEKLKAGDDYYTHVYREPISSGRQMMAMKIKLVDDYLEEGLDEFDFGFSAFLHKSMTKHAMDGDYDKDSVTVFRLNSLSQENMKGIYRGQEKLMEDILTGLAGADETLIKEAFGVDQINTGNVNELLDSMAAGGASRDRIRVHSFDAMMKLSAHGHGTPIIESYLAGRSYVDHMIGMTMDMSQDSKGRQVLQNNMVRALGVEKGERLTKFIHEASSLFIRQEGDEITRLATYNYTDARNLIKYMFLKKAGHGRDSSVGIEIADLLIKHSDDFGGASAESQYAMVNSIIHHGEGSRQSGTDLVNDLAEKLIKAAGMIGTDELSDIDPVSLSLLQRYAGQQENLTVASRELARQMLFSNAVGSLYVNDPGGMPGENILKDFDTIMRRTGGSAAGELSGLQSATARGFIQALTMDPTLIEEIDDQPRSVEAARARQNVATRAMAAAVAEDGAADSIVHGSKGIGGASTSKSAYTNALISGEFFRKFSQSRFFKPAAAIAGGLAAVETIRSSISSVSPYSVPAMGYASANTMPPPPIMSSPQDPSFNSDAIQNTNVIRLSRNYGQKTRLNVSGKMDNAIDFRGIANEVGLNNGYVSNIQGSFNYTNNDIMSSNNYEQILANKMGSSF